MPSPRPLPFSADNYLWCLPGSRGPVLVDPGEAAPVFAHWADGPPPAAILVTHHHHDHVGGIPALLARWPNTPVLAPHDTRIACASRRLDDGESFDAGDYRFEAIAVPGHTCSHLAFHGHGLLFCGDALFSLGCGRMFEGDAATMHASLARLAALPGETQVYCAHEYTLANAAFAQALMPQNKALALRVQEARQARAEGRPTLPTTIAAELATNPFLRLGDAELLQHLHAQDGLPERGPVDTFARLRRLKDAFRA